MRYSPGLILGLFGIAYVIWGLFERHPLLKRSRLIQGTICVVIAVIVHFLFRPIGR